MEFCGTMLITPVGGMPFEVAGEWKYKEGVWYGNGESYPIEICKIVFVAVEPAELIPENDTQELWEQNGRVKALIAYAELHGTMPVEGIKAMLGYKEEENHVN